MKEINVVGAAIIEEGKILIAQRSENMSAPMKWEFVGGKVEEGETHKEALKREVFEELGVQIMPKSYVASGILKEPGRKISLHVYEAEIVVGVPVLKEHNQAKWVEIDEMASMDWAKPDIPACKVLIRKYN